MSQSDVEELFIKFPDQAFRLTLASGDQVIVADPAKTLFTSHGLIIGKAKDSDRLTGTFSVVSIPNISLIEPIPRPQPGGRGRQRL